MAEMNPVAANWPVDPNEMPLRKKYTVKKAANKGVNKKHNSGGVGKKALSTKRGRSICSRTSPEQYGRWAALMKANNEPILG